MAGKKRVISFGFTGEFITQIAREWFYSGEKSIEKRRKKKNERTNLLRDQ